VALVAELKPKLVGSWLLEAFSQEKDEVVFAFAKQGEDVYIKCQIGAGFQSLTFLSEFHRARKNSADLFKEVLEQQVLDIRSIPNDRSFVIDLEKGNQLFFKLHGSKANVVLYRNNKGISQFHKAYSDLALLPFSFAKEPDFSIHNLVESNFDFKTLLPSLGSEPISWLKENGFQEADEEGKIELVCQLLEMLHYPKEFYILNDNSKAKLSFFKNKEVLAVCDSAIIEKKKKLVSYLAASQKRFQEITTSNVFEETANILMANLHAIPARAESVVLFDFYKNEDREIKLKKDLNPQKNAEQYYRKAKNVGAEVENLKKIIDIKTAELEAVEASISKLEAGETLAKKESQTIMPQKQETNVPYKRFEFEGFEIRVGKSSQKNDELIQQHATKNDLWLHARGCAGSHVIIKSQTGKLIPQAVIEKAATLAAWYSKGKNDSLCPVIVTEKKYVRKAKGMAPGQVIVEKEKTLMVVPTEF
jgi:predicted ribosome quality control (RQC) complex YloA/Tae2 family protein